MPNQSNLNHLKTIRHSCSHLLAMAVKELYPDVKFGIGPAIENGFYYDFKFPKPISENDLLKIEKKMKELQNQNITFEKMETGVGKGSEKMKSLKQPYKMELIEDLKNQGEKKVSFYQSGNFTDLCAGPHVNDTSEIGPFKLLSLAGAYWKGDEKNKMLTRIYGTCFEAQQKLDKYLWQLKEAKKRDHRKLGQQLELWTFSELVGAGLPLFTQKGALVRQLINQFVEDLQIKQEISQVWTPQFSRAELFKISGHYDKYKENMFKVFSNYSQEEFFLKPMNCPQHTQIYASKKRSYRELPIRMSDFAMLYRDEKPGELSGLARVRAFSQDDCHVFCREDQVAEEMHKALDMTKEIMEVYDFKYRYRLSTRDPKHPEKYIGDLKVWRKAEKLGEQILKERGIDYFPSVGEAAFYGPKLDLMAIDCLNREWQLSTLQIDFVMPERFNLTYIDKKGRLQRPVMLHRAISGSPERLMMILLEHYEGVFPVWLSPAQVIVLPISDKYIDHGQKILTELKKHNIRPEIDDRNETLPAKIRDAQMQKIPYMLVVGVKETEKSDKNNLYVSVRLRDGRDLKIIKLSEFIPHIKNLILDKSLKLW